MCSAPVRQHLSGDFRTFASNFALTKILEGTLLIRDLKLPKEAAEILACRLEKINCIETTALLTLQQQQ